MRFSKGFANHRPLTGAALEAARKIEALQAHLRATRQERQVADDVLTERELAEGVAHYERGPVE